MSGASPGQMAEVSLTSPPGTHIEFSDGSMPLVMKTASGRMSPVRTMTMKEYDQQLAELKKENFNLKLRIYFLEQNSKKGGVLDSEREIIDIKVENESLKKELQDKTEILKRASSAIDTISTQHQNEIAEIKEKFSHSERKVDVLERENKRLNEELKDSLQSLEDKDDHLKESFRELNDLKSILVTKSEFIEKLEEQLQSNGNNNNRFDEASFKIKIEKRNTIIQELTKQLRVDKKELEKKENDIRESKEKIEELQSYYENKLNMGERREQILQMDEFNGKQNLLDDSNKTISSRDRQIEEFSKIIEQKNRQLDSMDNDGLTENLREEIESLRSSSEKQHENYTKSVEELETELKTIKNELEQRDIDISRANEILAETEQAMDCLRIQTTRAERERINAEAELERLRKELNSFRAENQNQLAEHEAIVQNLKTSLHHKQKEFKEDEKYVKQLENGEKSVNLIENLKRQHLKAVNELRRTNFEKDEESRRLVSKLEAELEELRTELNDTKTELNRKDLEIEKLDRRSNWVEDNNQEQLEKLRGIVKEKNTLIDTLVKAAGEKEAILDRLRKERIEGIDSFVRRAQQLSENLKTDRLDETRLEAAVDELAFNASRLSEKINLTGLTGLSYLPSFNGLPDTPFKDADLPENARHLRDEFTEKELEIENLRRMKSLSSEEDLRRKSTSKIPRPNSAKRRQSDSSLKASRENLDAGKNDDAFNEIKKIKETAEKLSTKFSEMIHQDSEGEVDCVDITSNNVVEFKYSLEDIIDRLSIFSGRIGANSLPLDIDEESEVVKRLKTRIDSLYLETKQQSEEIKKLESLADQRLDDLNELMCDLSKKDDELQSVKCYLSSVERPRDGSESSRRLIEDQSPFKSLREPSLGSEPTEGASIPPVDLETAQKIFELSQDIEQLQNELDMVKKESEESKEELENTRTENGKFREEIESLHNQIEDTMTHSKDIKQALEERISILQNELETKDSELGTLAREAKRLREELEENRSEEILQELDRVKAERDELVLRKSLNTTPKMTPHVTPQSSPLRLSPHSTSSSRVRPSSPGDSLGVPSPMSFSSIDYVPKGYFGALAQKMIVEHEMDKIRKDYRSKELASRYSIEDPRCPPVASPVRIGSDLRTLYALGKLDDFELLKKQVEECKSLVSGVTLRLDQRLKSYGRLSPSNSPDYSVLREVNMNVVNVQHVIQEVQRIISLFWVTEAGSADPTVEKQLRFKIGELECRLSARDEEYFKLIKKLRETNERKRRFQEQLIAKLDENNTILGKAQGNLEKRISNGDYNVPHETVVI